MPVAAYPAAAWPAAAWPAAACLGAFHIHLPVAAFQGLDPMLSSVVVHLKEGIGPRVKRDNRKCNRLQIHQLEIAVKIKHEHSLLWTSDTDKWCPLQIQQELVR